MSAHGFRRKLSQAAAGIVLGGFASGATACPFCTTDKGDSLQSYYTSTILLSFVPLAIFGSIFLWLRRNARRVAGDGRSALPGTNGTNGTDGAPPSDATS